MRRLILAAAVLGALAACAPTPPPTLCGCIQPPPVVPEPVRADT